MSDEVRGIKEILAYVCPFVPKDRFERREDVKVWGSAYRVYGIPLSTYQKRPLVADFEDVRAVFLYWDAPFPRLFTTLSKIKSVN